MHETRKGEMPALGEVPFGRYYGGVDTTPLFVALADAYQTRTGDDRLIEELWPALEAAMRWIETDGDSDGDGLIDYARGQDSGLSNQGWKDSEDSVFHADGRYPSGPIALVEVQGYAFAAYRGMARLAERRGESARRPSGEARPRPCARRSRRCSGWRSAASTASLSTARASSAACCPPPQDTCCFVAFPRQHGPVKSQSSCCRPRSFRLGRADARSGRGALQPDQLPQRLGLAPRHGALRHGPVAIRRARGRRPADFRAVRNRQPDEHATAGTVLRLPRAPGEPPVAYPVACLPQAWAAGSVFMMLQACLGVSVDANRGEIVLVDPRLPIGIDKLRVERLRVGDETVDLTFERQGDRVSVRAEGGAPLTIRSKPIWD